MNQTTQYINKQEELSAIDMELAKLDELDAIDMELAEIDKADNPSPTQSPEVSDDGLMRKVGVTAKGFAEGVGGLVDAGAAIGNASLNDGSFTYDDNPPIDKSVVTPSDKPFTPTNDVTAQNYLGNQVNKLFGTNLDPKDAFEKFLNLAGAFSVPLGTGSKGSGILKNLANHELAAAGGATGVVAAEEAGIENPLIKMAAGGVGATLPSAIKALPNAIKSGAAKAVGYGPENINLKVADAYERLNLTPKNTVVNESTNLLSGEKLLNEVPYLGNKHIKNLKEADNNYSKLVQDTLESSGKRISHADNPGDIIYDTGVSLKDTLSKVKEAITLKKNKLYEEADNLLPEDAVINPANVKASLKKIKGSIDTLGPSETQESILSYLNKLEKSVLDKQDKITGKIPVKTISGTKISLNDKINWETVIPDAKGRYKELRMDVIKDLQEYGKTNPEWKKLHKNADNFYSKFLGDEALGSDIVKSILNEKNPEKILNSIKKVSEFKNIENALGYSEKGKEFFNSLKREKLENLISGKVYDPVKDATSYAPFAKLMKNGEQAHLIKYLIGESQFSKLKDLATIAGAEVAKEARNTNKSGTGYKTAALTSGGGIVTILGQMLWSGEIATAIATGALAAGTATTLSKVVTSKKLMNYAVNAAKARQKGDMVNATKWGKLADKTALEELGEKAFRELTILEDKPKEKA